MMKSEILTYPPIEEVDESFWFSVIFGSLETSENMGEWSFTLCDDLTTLMLTSLENVMFSNSF